MLDDRFWSKVDKSGDCWEWTALKRGGYGLFKLNNETKSAHRLSYEDFYGTPPGDEIVCHTCDNRACVRPEHLFLGSYKDNHDDMLNKDRAGYSLSKNQVLEIYNADLDENSMNNLIEKYNVPYGTIRRILNGSAFVYWTGGQPRQIPVQRHKQKLSVEDERIIYERVLVGSWGIKSRLAEEYGVSNSTITRIMQRKDMED